MAENEIIADLGDIRVKLWDYDIPSPCCPEYVEHHNQIIELMKLVDEKMEKYRGKKITVESEE